MYILSIETSCDETAAAIIGDGKVYEHVVSRQIIHEKYGGVVPELASRAHEKMLPQIVRALFKKSHIAPETLTHVAYTQGPGLLGSLMVGVAWAKAFAWAKKLTPIGIDHLQAHMLSHFIEKPFPSFPFLSLLISGGHTCLMKVIDFDAYELLGQTRDDAVGEAFDKIAKMLGLGYPGGAEIDKYARKGNPKSFHFPQTKVDGLHFSFSGIKTALWYFLQKENQKNPHMIKKRRADLCASVEEVLTNMLIEKLTKAVAQTHIKNIGIAGGTAANTGLRNKIAALAQEKQWKTFIPKPCYCTDNAAMVGIAAYYLLQKKNRDPSSDFMATAYAKSPLTREK